MFALLLVGVPGHAIAVGDEFIGVPAPVAAVAASQSPSPASFERMSPAKSGTCFLYHTAITAL